MRSFTYSDAKSHKFWNIDVTGNSFTVTYGKIGSAGQTQTKTFPTAEKAQAEAEKLIKEKVGKGYVEVGGAAAAVKSDRAVLEDAILADPNDRAAFAAYADLLMEAGDPRGEFVRVQLALEDESLGKKERDKLKKREKELLAAHEREWLGELAPVFLEQQLERWERADTRRQNRRDWVRGCLLSLYVADLTVEAARALVRNPDKFPVLRELRIGETGYEEEYEPGPDIPEDAEEYTTVCLYPLTRWPHLKKLRVFQLGMMESEDYKDYCEFNCHTEGDLAFHLVKQMPDVEELYLLAHNVDTNKLFAHPMPKLRVLQVYHAHRYPLAKLAKNKSLTNLTHLLLHPHVPDDYEEESLHLADLKAVITSPNLPNLTHLRLRICDAGDAGCREIVKSGILKRLKVLDLRHGLITDEGAKALAACPDLKNLQLLDVSRNCLTKEGIAALEATGVTVQAGYQGNSDGEYHEHMYHGDIE